MTVPSRPVKCRAASRSSRLSVPDGTETAREVVNFQANAGMEHRGAKFPQVALAPAGQFVVMWWDDVDGETRLHAQRFDQSGELDGQPYDIHGTGLTGSRLFARAEATNDFIQYVWSDSRRGRGWDIRSRRVDWDFNGAPSPVGIAGWETRQDGSVLRLSWRTSVERDFAGFHVWRQLAGETPSSSPIPVDDAVRLTRNLLEARPDARYDWTDATLTEPGTYEYLLQAVDTDGSQEFHGPFQVEWWGDAAVASNAIQLSAWPLPFRSQLNLRIDTAGTHQLEIVDASGRRIRRLGVTTDGQTPVTWDGRDARGRQVPSGVYFVRPLDSPGEPLRILRIE